jgi:hypothetical protein
VLVRAATIPFAASGVGLTRCLLLPKLPSEGCGRNAAAAEALRFSHRKLLKNGISRQKIVAYT